MMNKTKFLKSKTNSVDDSEILNLTINFRFDQFGFVPSMKQDTDSDRKDDSLSSRIIRLRKKRKDGDNGKSDSPLDMIQCKFNQIFRSLKK